MASLQLADRWAIWPAVVAALSMLAWMARGLATGEVPFTGDLLHFHYPLRDFYAHALTRGQSFDWMPSLYGGFYVVGEGQLGAYHPVHWGLYRWLPLDRAFAIELVLAYPLLFAGTWRWLRAWVGHGAAAFGALATAYSGFSLVHGVHPNVVGVMAHVPWLLRSIDDLSHATGPRQVARALATVALLVGSQLLLGHPQSVWFSTLITVAYAALVASWTSRDQRHVMAKALVAALGLGALVGALQLLATLDALRHSTRPAYDVTFATAFSLAPSQLWQLVHPYLAWGRVSRWNEAPGAGDEYGVYGGGVVVLLAVWWVGVALTSPATTGEDGRRRRLAWAAAAFAVVGVWLALGRNGGLYLVQTWLPFVNQFRAPVRYTLFTQWSLAVMASVALVRLLRADDADPVTRGNARMPLGLAWSVVALAVASAAWLAQKTQGTSEPSWLAVWWGPIVMAVTATLITVASRRTPAARVAVAGLVLAASVDFSVYGLGIPAWQDQVTRGQAVAYLDSNSFLPSPGPGRLARGGFPNLFVLGGHRLLDGYVAIIPRRQLDYRQPAALRAAQVDFAHADWLAGAPVPDAQPMDRGWLRLPPSLPRARLVSEAMVSTVPAADITRIDVERVALVERAVALEPGPPGDAEIARDNPGRIDVRVTTGGRQLLVLSESYDEGWRVSVDSQPGEVERANGDFLGTVVPAGAHQVEFTFAPGHLVVGKMVSATAAAVALGLLLWARGKGSA